ncbi:MAG TPA: sigma factor [Allosphingosinicella sp.]|nr:sigma factor [Allosphingosinicella sp.]
MIDIIVSTLSATLLIGQTRLSSLGICRRRPEPACLTCVPGRKGGMTAGETHRAIEATFRIERARLIAGLARMVGNIDLAEELAQDSLVAALAEWPRAGVPANPGAWLMAVAKRRALDALRRDKMRTRKHEEIAREQDGEVGDAAEAIEAAMATIPATSCSASSSRPATPCCRRKPAPRSPSGWSAA